MDIETASLRAVASDLAGAGQAFTDIGGDLGAIGGIADPVLQVGVEAVTVAFSTVLQLLGEDATFLSGHVGGAAEVYDTTDGGLAAVIDATRPGSGAPGPTPTRA